MVHGKRAFFQLSVFIFTTRTDPILSVFSITYSFNKKQWLEVENYHSLSLMARILIVGSERQKKFFEMMLE
jgi:hypothetical protein